MLLFAISFFTVSVIPGIDMLSALSFGMRYGYKKTLFLMLGQLSALAVIVAFSVVFAGAVYLLYTGLGMLAQGKAAHARSATQETRARLFVCGALITLANPKAHIFLFALISAFLPAQGCLPCSGAKMLLIALAINFASLSAYAFGGAWLANAIKNELFMRGLFVLSGLVIISIAAVLALEGLAELK